MATARTSIRSTILLCRVWNCSARCFTTMEDSKERSAKSAYRLLKCNEAWEYQNTSRAIHLADIKLGFGEQHLSSLIQEVRTAMSELS